MSEHIINQVKKTVDENEIDETVGYAIAIKPNIPPITIDPNDIDCLAKQRTTNAGGRIRVDYYVRVGVGGRIYDPWNNVDDSADRQYIKHAGKIGRDFQRVTERCFTFYMRYLQSRNPAQYINTQREAFS